MENLKIYFVTWNVMGRPPMSDLRSLLNLKEPVDVVQLPDIFAIGLQEVSVKPHDLLIDAIFDDPWLTGFREILTDYEYIKMKQMRLQGIMLMLFCKKEHITHLRGVQTDYTRTGFGGMWGNKGGVSIRFNAYGCSVCIVNAHLAASDDEISRRISDYNSIIDKQRFVDPQTENILTHDYVFWIGDLNFRIDELTTDEVMYLISINSFPPLLTKDQLTLVQRRGEAFSEFKEVTPDFPPTYKFVIDGNNYDFEKRKPAWTDRILYRYTRDAYTHTNLEVKQLHYSSHSYYSQSDHKPVSGSFLIKIFPNPLEKKVTFLPIKNWKCYQDGEATYYFNENWEPNGWDWIGLFKHDFKGLDEHINYVWASTKPVTDPKLPSESSNESEETTEVHRTIRYISKEEEDAKTTDTVYLRNKHCSETGCKAKTPLTGKPSYVVGSIDTGISAYYHITFVDQVPLVPGLYHLLYIGSEFNDVLGISPIFEITRD